MPGGGKNVTIRIKAVDSITDTNFKRGYGSSLNQILSIPSKKGQAGKQITKTPGLLSGLGRGQTARVQKGTVWPIG